jgi:hypothetical protein
MISNNEELMYELIWYDKYKLTIKDDFNKNLDKFIKLLSNQHEKNITNKISEIENNYFEKIKYIENLFSDKNKINLIKKQNSLIILQKELDIIKILTKYTLQNKILNYNFIKICLLLLLEFSNTLKNRLKQKDINHKNMQQNDLFIIRCSYKFCSYQDKCAYNYNSKSKNYCYHDHYVHNMVSADLNILLDYINENKNNDNNIIHTKEILKTINTLSYVISHMETELKAKCLYCNDKEIEYYHINKKN